MIMESQATNSKTLEIWNNGVKSIIHIPINMGTVEPVIAPSLPVCKAVPSPLAKVQIGESRSKQASTVEIIINDDPSGDNLEAAGTDTIETNSPQVLPSQLKHNINIQPASTTTTNTIDFRMSTQVLPSQYPVTSLAPSVLPTNVLVDGTSEVNPSDFSVKNVITSQHFSVVARPPFRNLLIRNPGSGTSGPRRFFSICPQFVQVDPHQQQQHSIRLQSVQQQQHPVQFRPVQKFSQQFQPFPQQIQQLQQQIKHLPQYIQQMPEQFGPVAHNSHQFPQYMQQHGNYSHHPYLEPQQATPQFNINSINTIHHHPSFHRDVQSSGNNVTLYLNRPQWLPVGQQQGIQPIIINFSSSQTVAAPPSLSSSHPVAPTTVLTSNFVKKILQSTADSFSGNVKKSLSTSSSQVSLIAAAAKKSKKKETRVTFPKTIHLHPPPLLSMSAMTNKHRDLSTLIPHGSSLDDLRLDINPKETASNVPVLEENDSGVASVDGKKGSPSSDLFSLSTEEICKDQEMLFTDAVNTFNKGIEEGDILNLLDGLLQEDDTDETAPPDTAAMTLAVNQPKPVVPKLSNQMSSEEAQANLAFVKSIKGREALEAARQARHQKRREMVERSSDEKSSGSWVPEEHCPESSSSWNSEDSVTMGKKNRKKKHQHISETKGVLQSMSSYNPARSKKYKLRSQDKNSREDSGSSRSSSLTSLPSSVTSSSIASSYSSTPSLPLSSSNSTTSSRAGRNLSKGNKASKRKAILNKLNELKKKSTNVILDDSVAKSERLPESHGIKIKIKIRSPTKKNPASQPHTDILKGCFVNLEKLNIQMIKDHDFVVNLKKSHKMLCCEKPSEKVEIRKSTPTSRSSDEECVVRRPVKRRKRILLTSDESG